jgi:hypothetical protein
MLSLAKCQKGLFGALSKYFHPVLQEVLLCLLLSGSLVICSDYEVPIILLLLVWKINPNIFLENNNLININILTNAYFLSIGSSQATMLQFADKLRQTQQTLPNNFLFGK